MYNLTAMLMSIQYGIRTLAQLVIARGFDFVESGGIPRDMVQHCVDFATYTYEDAINPAANAAYGLWGFVPCSIAPPYFISASQPQWRI